MVVPCDVQGCTFVGFDLHDFCLHLRRVHAYSKTFTYKCIVEECGIELRGARNVESHFQRMHPDVWGAHDAQGERRVDAAPNIIEAQDVEPEAPPAPDAKQAALKQFNNMLCALRAKLPASYLRLQYTHGVPTSVARRIHDEYMNMMQVLVNGSANVLPQYASTLDINDTTFRAMLQCREVDYMCRTSTHKEDEQFRKLGLVKPVQINMQEEAIGVAIADNNPLLVIEEDADDVDARINEEEVRDMWGEHDGDDVDEGNAPVDSAHFEQEGNAEPDTEPDADGDDSNDVYHYVSILETLKSYLKHDDVVAEIRSGASSHQGDGIYDDYTSGTIYQESGYALRGPHHLRILLYTDEVTVTNPLQGHSRNHKLAVVYFIVQNIAGRSQSSLCSIHLVAVAKWSYVKKYSYDVFFKRIIADIISLDTEGLDITTVNGEHVHFTGSLVAVSADNLSAHALGGFRCCFSSGKICRFCLISYENMRGMTCENDPNYAERTKENVRRHALSAAADKQYQSVYGLVGESCLYALPNFNPVTHLPPDIMHDILESFMPCHVRNLLMALNARPAVYRFSAARAAIRAFKYAKADSKNRPPNFPADWAANKKGIGGTAAEKWNLFRLLPFMIGEHIPQDSRHWHLYKLALKICDIILAFKVTDEMLDELANLIHDHHVLWVQLYPDSFPCKFHYLVHYPRLFRQFGVLRKLWTTRFESFHRYIKSILLKGRNFINETKTASERFQKMRCLQYHEGNSLPSKINIVGKSNICTLGTMEPLQARQHVAQLLECGEDTIFTAVSQVSYNGQMFYPNCFTIVALQYGCVPLFMKTIAIYLHEDTVVLYGCAVTTCDFNEHYQAYVVEERREEVFAIAASDVASNQTLASYIVGGSQMIRCRFRPVVD